MNRLFILALGLCLSLSVLADSSVTVKDVTAQQRYPWNGLVDIVVTLEGVTADELNLIGCSFAATNSATGAVIPVTSITRKGSDTGSGTIWKRRFVWDAATDVGEVRTDDVALTVGAKVLGVQLWENGPYWAESNVGATMPEDYGYYFWWGDTVGYKRNASNNGWVSVKDGTSYSFSDCPTYCMDISSLRSAGYIDSTGNLVAAHDAATAHLGAPWRMPTDAEFAALISNCDMTWTTCGGVYGRLVTGRGAYVSKSIFLPAAGRGSNSDLYYPGSGGHYWSSTPHSNDSLYACQLYLNSSDFLRGSIFRYRGHPLRPVRELAQSVASGVVASGVETHLKLDCQTGVRVCSAEGEMIAYSTDWVEGAGEGAVAVVSVNGEVISEQPGSGTVNWTPTRNGTYKLTHKVMVNGEQVGESLTASFSDGGLPEIIGVTAQQRYPWNGKVDISYTVVNAKTEELVLSVWAVDQTTGITNVAETVTGDIAYTNGLHRIVWDMEADGLAFVSTNSLFTVSYGGSVLGCSDPVRVDLTPGTRTAAETEMLTYSTAWVEGAGADAVAVVSVNGKVVSERSGSGTVEWAPTRNGTYELTHKVMVGGEQVGESLTSTFNVNHCPPGIIDVTAQQRYPWNGKVDISYTVVDARTEELVLSVWAVDQTTGITNVAETVTGDVAYTNGQHHVVWDMAADGLTLVSTNVVFGVSYVELPLYCVIDLSGGTSAASYPVTYRVDAPSGGWSDKYKTTKLVMRRVEPGTCVVTVDQPYYIGVFEVTQTQWELVMGTTPSRFGNNPMRPVEMVSYDMIRGSSKGSQYPASTDVDDDSFMGKLRARTGLHVDLPTEAQWEYACRAGTTTAYSYGDSANGDYMWYETNSESSTHDVGTRQPNPWGLYDAHGNVWEWCLEWYPGYEGSARVLRGGSWYDSANNCRSAYRKYGLKFDGWYGSGFRLVRTLSGTTSGSAVAPGISDPVRVDLTPGTRTAAKTEALTYSTDWVEGAGEGAVAVVSVNGEIISQATGSGTVEWTPTRNGAYELTHKVMVGGEQVGETLTANFHVDHLPYITDVTARQRYPWNGKVDISYMVVNAGTETRELSVWAVDQTTGITNVAWHVTGDTAYVSGLHHIVWDMAADGLTLVSTNVVFGVSYEKVKDLYCVIDLSGGTSAASYPVTYLEDVPSGGWSDEYKTSILVLRKIPAGTFTMGSPTDELGRNSNEAQHKVTLTKSYWTGVFQVTQRQWELVMGTRPSYFNNNAYYAPRPVEQVSYDMIRGSSAGAGWPDSPEVDADSFLGVLRAKSGLHLDLPTEAQWEYACRAGTTTALNSGKDLTSDGQDSEMDKVGRYFCNGEWSHSQSCDWSAGTAKVGSYAPNAWGIYDMHGNVEEWCLDRYELYSGDATDPKGPSSGSYRVMRGGSWSDYARDCRSAYRSYDYPLFGGSDFGFRLVRTLSNTEEVKIKSEKVKSESVAAATSGAGVQGVSDPVRIDLTLGARTAAKIETITYSSEWVEGTGEGAVSLVSINGEVISEQSGSGTVDWTPPQNGTYALTHQVVAGGVPVGETLTAAFLVNHFPDIVFTASGSDGTYDGTGHGISVDVTDPAEGAVVTYSRTQDGEFTTLPILFTNVTDDAQSVYFKITADGYQPTSGVETVRVTPKTLTADMIGAIADRVYTGEAHRPEVTVSDVPPCVITVDDYTVEYADNVNAGVGRAIVTGKGNYTGVAEKTFVIQKANYDMSRVSWDNIGRVTYDGKQHEVKLQGLPSGVVPSYQGNAATAAGSYVASATLSYDTRNYNPPPSIAPNSWGIDAKDITVSAVDAGSIYGEPDAPLTYSASGLVGSDALSGSPVRAPGVDVGTYPITIGTLGNPNYSITFKPGVYTISPRPVTLTSGSAEKKYDSTPLTNPDIAISGSGWASGEGATYEVTGSQTEVGESKNTFTHTLLPGTKATNYAVSKVEGTLRVLSNPKITDVTAQQRYPWNGLVDIVVTLKGVTADRVSDVECFFVATNSATGAAIPVTSITRKGADTGSGTTWIRRFVWDAAADVGEMRIDDITLTVDAQLCVQLWENGPYWAECNVGAAKPEDYGYCFWWGDTVGYKRNADDTGWISVKDGSNFLFDSGHCPTYGMNNSQLQSAGYIDATGNLVSAHDAATAHVGAPWRMPTDAEFNALISCCDTQWTTRDGVYGRLVTGRGAYASKSIFLPAAGDGDDSYLCYAGSDGFYWSSTPNSGNSGYTWGLNFDSGSFSRSGFHTRYRGRSVRPVLGFANGATTSVVASGFETHLKLDCRTGERSCAEGAETLSYDAGWYENAVCVQVYDGSTRIAEGVSGSVVWQPVTSSSHTLKLMAYDSGGVRIGQESVTRSFAHIEVVTTKAVEPTCTEAGCTKGSYCSRCQAVLAISEVLPALGHIEVVTTKAKEPTCTEDGCTKGAYCSRCKAVLAISEVLPALGHVGVITKPAVEPTSGEAGSTAEITCSRCGLVLQEATVIPALGYIRNVTARQLWPHKKVEVCYTLADDIGEVVEEGMKLSLSCSGSGLASAWARTVIGDTSCTPGFYRVAWDMEADGVKAKADDVKFGVYVGNGNPGFVTKTFYSPSLVFDKTSDVWGGTIVSSPSQLYATSLAEHTTVAYGCYMYMTAGVTYSFKGRYDDFTAVKVNGSWVMGNSSECQESSGSFKPTTTGYYPVEFRVGNNSGPGGCTGPNYYGIQWKTSVNTNWRNVGNTASETVFFASPASSKISGISAAVPIDTSDAVCDGMSVGPTVALGYSPIDTREAAIQIDGTAVFSSTNSGTFVWQPCTKGNHTLVHVAGTNVWTRTVNVTNLVHEVPAPKPGRDPDPNMSLAATERRLESPAAANGAIGTKGSGTWTATASDAWITINVATRKVGLPVGYAVAENRGVEERIGYIYVNGHVYTITQPGVGATLETTSADFETDGGRGSVVVRADAQATWHAWSNVDWVSVETTAGQGEDTVTFVVAPYNAVTTRSGTLTIAGTTFTVKQTGRRMKLSAEEMTKDYLSHDVPLMVEALASTTWGIALDAPWMSVLDGGKGKGGGQVTLAINENPSYLPRTATALIGTETFTLHQQGRPTEALSFAISPETTAADVRGANGIVSVLATPDLPWTAESQASWLTVMPGFSFGAGNGNMVYAASPNPTMSNRTGTIRVEPLETTGLAGKTHTVSQPAAVAFISEDAHTFAAKGDSFDVTVMVDDIVGWSISKNADWVSIVGDLSRTGPGKVTINVAENMSVSPREATIRIAGHAFQIVQLGRAFELEYEEIGPQSPTAAYTEFSIEVIPDGNVSWKAVASNLDMIYIWSEDPNCENMEDGSVIGTGSATLKYMLLEYVGTGEARTGWIQIGDKKVYVTQRSYDLWIDPCATNVTGNAGAGEVSVSATIGQVWEAIATEPWITVISGASGKGSGTVLYTYTDNNTGVVRTGKIIIAGEAYTVTQAARQLAQVTVMGEGEGTWTGAGTYDKGTRVTLVASPSEGWRFVAWCDSQGETVGTDPTLTVVADRDMTLVAVFEFIPVYIVNGEAVREGTVKAFAAPDPVVLGGTTQLVCRGTSAYPEKGPSFSLKIMGDVRFEWDLWTTNYWVAVAQAEHGTVTARDGARALPGWVEAGNDVAVTATPESGYSLMRLTGVAANPATVTEPLTVGAIFGVFDDTIAEAADAPSLAFRTGGDSDWAPVIDPTAKVGYTSVRSGVARPEDETWVETVVSGAGTLTFNWKVDCERDDSGAAEWDRLSVFTNGVEAARLDGKTDWQRVTLPLTAERTTVRWSFYRDDYDEAGTACENAAWIDGVELSR